MYRLRLIKGLSCKAGKVRATRAQTDVDVEDKIEAENALATGYFELISSPDDEGNDGEAIQLQKMTEKQLGAYAVKNGIILTGCKNKAEKLAKILDAEAPLVNDEGNDGEADFGEDDI